MIEILVWLFFTYSFAGWMMESVGGILNVKKFVNRGFLIGPLCPVYGTGVVIITIFLNKYVNDIFALFVLATVLCGILEYLTSYTMEKLFNARWWDYSKRKFNINGRICLENLCLFGISGSIILCVINPFLINLYSKVPEPIRYIFDITICVLFIIDFSLSLRIMLSFKGATYNKVDNTEEISNKVKDKAEDILMQAESDAIHSIRKYSVKRQRKMRYKRSLLDERMKTRKEHLELRQKQSREFIERKLEKTRKELEIKTQEKIKQIKESSEEFSKQIKERFSSESLLKRRLINAFPDMKINIQNRKNKNIEK